MAHPVITPAEIEAVNWVMQTPYLSIGPRIAEFEERFAAYVGTGHTVGVSSGTAGLHLSVIAAGVAKGELVRISASVIPQRHVGAWSVVDADSVITKDIPAYATAVGVPARLIRQLCENTRQVKNGES